MEIAGMGTQEAAWPGRSAACICLACKCTGEHPNLNLATKPFHSRHVRLWNYLDKTCELDRCAASI